MEEIVLQGIGDAAQQGNVDIVLAENLVYMRAGAANVVGQLCGRRALLPHHLFDMLPDVHGKSVELVQPVGHRVSTPIISTSYSTPIKKMAFHNGS